MSYSNALLKMKGNPTYGEEFNHGNPMDGVLIGHTKCEYCDCEILGVWDEHNMNHWWPYLGNQCRKPNVYRYSRIIQAMKEHFDALNKVWTEENGNNLLNVHARAHSEPTDWSVRASSASIRLLCNRCFQMTYKRVQIKSPNGIIYAISVLPQRGETVESVCNDLGIKGEIIGNGAINDYLDPKKLWGNSMENNPFRNYILNRYPDYDFERYRFEYGDIVKTSSNAVLFVIQSSLDEVEAFVIHSGFGYKKSSVVSISYHDLPYFKNGEFVKEDPQIFKSLKWEVGKFVIDPNNGYVFLLKERVNEKAFYAYVVKCENSFYDGTIVYLQDPYYDYTCIR